jgi:hypothetical protein
VGNYVSDWQTKSEKKSGKGRIPTFTWHLRHFTFPSFNESPPQLSLAPRGKLGVRGGKAGARPLVACSDYNVYLDISQLYLHKPQT